MLILDDDRIRAGLKRIRLDSGLSILDTAKRLGYKSASGYQNIESSDGIISIQFLNNFSQVFQVPVAKVLGIDEGADGQANAQRAGELELRLENERNKNKLLRMSAAVSPGIGRHFFHIVGEALAPQNPTWAQVRKEYQKIAANPGAPEHRRYFDTFFRDERVRLLFGNGLVPQPEWQAIWDIHSRNKGWEDAPGLPPLEA